MKKNPTLSNTIVFIAGAFIGMNCWDGWKMYFESRGYRCIIVPWPYKDASPEELRNRNPEVNIASVRLSSLVDGIATFIDSLPEKPILIGHSLGGLIVQLLLQRGLGCAGVAVHSFPALGGGRRIFSLLRGWWDAMGFFSPAGVSYLMPFKRWKDDFTNGMSYGQQKQLYYSYAVPESKLLIRDLLSSRAKPDFANMPGPLLIISGSLDRVSPSALNRLNYKKYLSAGATVFYKEFNGFNHLVFAGSRWGEIPDNIVSWLDELYPGGAQGASRLWEI